MPTVAYVHSAHSPSSLRQPPDWPPVDADVLALFRAAQHIRIELRERPSFQPLRGKNLALLMACPPGPGSALLQAAASQLGTRVALVRYTYRADAQARDIETLAAAMGRMYDAIDCESLPAAVPRQLSRCAGVPVIESLGSEQHRVCALADLMTLLEHPLAARGEALDEARRADNHLRLVQAVLLDAMAGQRGW